MKFVVAMVLVLAVAVPAAAAAGEQVMPDPCGDLLVHGHVQGEPVSTPGDVTTAFDIESASLTSVDGGVDAAIDVCGEAATPEGNQSYGFGWGLGESCSASLHLGRETRVDVGAPDETGLSDDLVAAFEQACSEPPGDGELIGTRTTIFRVVLPESAWSIEGGTVRFSLRSADLPAPAAALLAPGTAWETPYARARFLPASGAGSVFFHDAQGAADLRVSDGADHAGTWDNFVVTDD